MLSRRSFGLGGLAAFTSACNRKKSAGYDIFVANEAGKAIAVVDLTAFALTKHIPLGESPTAVIADPLLARVYALAPQSGTVYEIDTNTLSIARKVNLGPAVSMRHKEGSLWVLGKRSLMEIPLDSFKRASSINLPADARDFDLSNHTKLAAISHGDAGSVSVIDLPSRKVTSHLRIADAVGAARFRSDGEGLLVADVAANHLCVMTARSQMVAKLPLAVRPDNLCFNPNGGQLFITGEGRDAVVVVFPYFVAQVAETVLAGHAPAAMAASPTYLFVANPVAGDVTILSIVRRKIVAINAVGADPGHISVTPDGAYALVLNRQSGDMAVIRTGAIVSYAPLASARKPAALFTMIPVGSRPVSAAVKAV